MLLRTSLLIFLISNLITSNSYADKLWNAHQAKILTKEAQTAIIEKMIISAVDDGECKMVTPRNLEELKKDLISRGFEVYQNEYHHWIVKWCD